MHAWGRGGVCCALRRKVLCPEGRSNPALNHLGRGEIAHACCRPGQACARQSAYLTKDDRGITVTVRVSPQTFTG